MKRLLIALILTLSLCSCSAEERVSCPYPENPYDETMDSGHYAGYEWAQENNENCDGNSESFNEGCTEYYNQIDRYDACQKQ